MSEPAWKQRFTVPTISDFTWAANEPGRVAVISTESGSAQAWSWDMATGRRSLASSGGVGAEEVHILPDGSGVVWWLDPTGDEQGHWMVTPFHGGEPAPFPPGLEDGRMMGISLAPGVAAIGISRDDGYAAYLAVDGREAREVYRHGRPAGVGAEWPQGLGGLSPDGSLLCLHHSETSDIQHPSLRVLETSSRIAVADLQDRGRALMTACWSPTGRRLAFIHEMTGIERPGVWEPLTGQRLNVELADVPGPVMPIDWFPDGEGLLLHAEIPGRQLLLRHDVREGSTQELLSVQGTIGHAGVRPDGDVWYLFDSGVASPAVRNLAGEEVLPLGPPAPAGRPFQAISWDNPKGQTIHGFVVTPDGPGPHPTIVSIHGGPEWHHTDGWDPATQAFADNGFAVLLVNYRGSSGRGHAFREELHANIGFPESEDINSGLDHLIDTGVADPGRVFLEGWSWGGYLTTLNAGLHPERWRAAVAGIPVGDYVAAHYECAPAIREWDLAILGGSPMDLPELYRERNPMTYVDRVTAPMLMIAGEHDSRCPLGQVMTYAHALRARGHPVEVELYNAGHHTNAVTERIRHTELTISFFSRHLEG